MRRFFKFRLGEDDQDIAKVLDDLSDGEASEFVKDAIRERIGIPTVSARLARVEGQVKMLAELLRQVLAKLGGST
ncbi:MAG: hypothetical protein HY868_25455 [Chloroflexi bacterium]|nr:hypothetical protein [Chloroflexota bacterium]